MSSNVKAFRLPVHFKVIHEWSGQVYVLCGKERVDSANTTTDESKVTCERCLTMMGK